MADEENEPKLKVAEAVQAAKRVLRQSDAISIVIIAMPEDDTEHEEAYVEGDLETLAVLSLRLQHLLLRMMDATTVNVNPNGKKNDKVEGYT